FLTGLDKPIEDTNVRDAVAYAAHVSGRRLSSSSIAQQVSALRSFLKHCQAQELMEYKPLDALKRPKVEQSLMGRYLDKEEAEQLLGAAREISPQAHLAIALMLLTGIRVRELTRAEWRNLFRDVRGRIGLRITHAKGK